MSLAPKAKDINPLTNRFTGPSADVCTLPPDVFIPSSISPNIQRKKCLIIYTGGTIGMRPGLNDGALVPSSGYLREILKSLPELQRSDFPQYELLEWDNPMDSSDFTPEQWILLTKQITQYYDDYDGFVVLHGTDSLAYTASALSFMLQNLNKTVVLTGSMTPLDVPFSDGRLNLFYSLRCIVELEVPEVCVFFHNYLFRGNCVKKVHPGRGDAYITPNCPPLAQMAVPDIIFDEHLFLPSPKRRMTPQLKLFTNIAVIVITPAFDDRLITAYSNLSDPTEPGALVLQLYGAGNGPTRQQSFMQSLTLAKERGIAVVITTQCFYGSTDLNMYETGSKLLKLGVIDARDMVIEAVVTKLSYLMGQGLRGNELKHWMESNIRGELGNGQYKNLKISKRGAFNSRL